MVSGGNELIKAKELRLTLGTAIMGILGVIGTTWDTTVEALLGPDPPSVYKLVLVVTILGVWAVIASVDMVTRALVTARHKPTTVALPEALGAKVTKGTDVDCSVSALQYDPKTDDTVFLATKKKGGAEWLHSEDLHFN